MSENTSKNSFFKEYFLYKLRTLRGAVITFAVMNFLSVTGFAAGVLVFFNALVTHVSNGEDLYEALFISSDLYILLILFLLLMAALIFATVLMLSFVPAVNFKFFNKREYMDTLGGLPLTVKQRYLGDMLSGATAFGLSFIPCSAIAAILALITELGPLRQLEGLDGYDAAYILPGIGGGYMGMALTILLTMFLCYAAAYAISCFVASCCGKVGTSVLFSLIAMGSLTVTTLSIGGLVVNNSIGFNTSAANLDMISAAPPFGTLISAIAATTGESVNYAVRTPLVLVILLIIALFGFGSYLAANRRKTERVERELVFNAGYYVIPAIITVTAGSFSIWLINTEKTYIIPLVLIALATCLVMAFLESRSFKKIWKGFAVFAAAGAFCLGLGALAEKTEGFGISKYIPSKNSIKSITLTGNPIFDTFIEGGSKITVESEDGIALVLSEHRKIVDEIENFSPSKDTYGWPLSISYKLKNGLSVTRSYQYTPAGSKEDDPTYKFAEAVSDLPELRSSTVQGLLTDPELPCTGIIYYGCDPSAIDDDMESDMVLGIKPSKYGEFAERYLEDLMNWQNDETDFTFGTIDYRYLDKNGNLGHYFAVLWASYDKTIEFLRDPDSFAVESDTDIDYTREYQVVFGNIDYSDGSLKNRIVFKITHPELAREFLSYLVDYGAGSEDASSYFVVYCFDDKGGYYSYTIDKSDEQAALSAFIKAIRAHEAIGGGNNDQN